MKKVRYNTVEALRGALSWAEFAIEVHDAFEAATVAVLKGYAKEEGYYMSNFTKAKKAEIINLLMDDVREILSANAENAEQAVKPEAVETVEPVIEAVKPVIVSAKPARVVEQYRAEAELRAIRKKPFEEKLKLFNAAVEEHQDKAFGVLRKYFTFDEIYRVAVMMEVPELVRIQSESQRSELLGMMGLHYATWYDSTHDTAIMRARAIKRADIYGNTWGGAMQWDKLVYCIRIIKAVTKADCSIKRYFLELCDDETRYRICKTLGFITPDHYAENDFATQSEYEEYLVISLEILLNQIMTLGEWQQQAINKAQEEQHPEEAEIFSIPKFQDFPLECTNESEKAEIVSHNMIEASECKTEEELRAYFMRCRNIDTLKEMTSRHFGKLPAMTDSSVEFWADWFASELWTEMTELRLRRADELNEAAI